MVEEAATDVIATAQAQGTAQPWTDPSFLDAVARLQRNREIRTSCEGSHQGSYKGSYQADEVEFHDRCVVCTAALATYLGYSVSPFLAGELERVKKEAVFQRRVFFVRNLGFVTPTEARRISYEDTLRFEKIHEKTYRGLGFDLIFVERGSLAERVSFIKTEIR